MFEFHIAECYLRQREERIASDAERHRITHLDRPGRKRALTKLAGHLRARLSRRGTPRVSSGSPSLSIVPKAAVESSPHPGAPFQIYGDSSA
jgi:hypothetical protein